MNSNDSISKLNLIETISSRLELLTNKNDGLFSLQNYPVGRNQYENLLKITDALYRILDNQDVPDEPLSQYFPQNEPQSPTSPSLKESIRSPSPSQQHSSSDILRSSSDGRKPNNKNLDKKSTPPKSMFC